MNKKRGIALCWLIGMVMFTGGMVFMPGSWWVKLLVWCGLGYIVGALYHGVRVENDELKEQ